MRGAASGSAGNMRNGLISLLTVVIVLSLATAAVLTVSTSHAMHSLSQRQATMTGEGYAAERSAQAMLAGIDEVLAKTRTAHEGAERVDKKINSILVESCAEGVHAGYELEGTTLTCTFTTDSGRRLITTVEIEDKATYRITSWRLTAAPQEQGTEDMLWTGSTADE